MPALMPYGKQQYLDNSGNPLVGGKLYTYAAGTSTPQITHSDAAGTVPNANPVVLDARGEASIFWSASPYKVVLKTSADVELWSQDNLASPPTSSDLASTDVGKGSALIGHSTTGETVKVRLDGLQSSITTVSDDLAALTIAADPFPQYTTDAEATALAASEVSAHEALPDPHTGYMRRVVTSSVSSTSGVAVDFTGIPSWAKRITILFSTLTTSGSSIPVFRAGPGGVPVTSGYVGCTSGVSTGASAGNHTDGARLFSTSWASSYVAHGRITFTLANPASNLWEYDGVSALSNIAAAAFFGGSIALAGALDIIRLTTQGGSDTFQSGTLRMIYEG